MTPFLIYYIAVIISIVSYFKIKSYYKPLVKRTKWVIYSKRVLIVSMFIISVWGIILNDELEGDTFLNFFFLISSVVILIVNVFLSRNLEILRN